MIRAAVIGLGRWGRNHVRAAQAAGVAPCAALRFTRAVVRDPAKSADYASTHGLALGTNLDEVLADPAIDAVVLATPNSQHAAQIEACARAGKSVLSEKPLALTLDSARGALAACERAGVVLAVGHDKRLWPSMQSLAEIVASGDLGTLLHVEGHFSNENARNFHTSWREDPAEAPGASLTGTGIHVLDAMIRMLGPVDRVRVLHRVLPTPGGEGPSPDALTATVEFAGGCTGVLCGVRPTPLFWRVHVFGTRGSAEAIGDNELVVRASGQPPRRRVFDRVDALRLQLEAFAVAVDRRAEGSGAWPVAPGELLGTVAGAEAVFAALRSGETIAAARP